MGPILIIIAVLLVIAKHNKKRNATNERCGANPIGRKLVMMVASSLVGSVNLCCCSLPRANL